MEKASALRRSTWRSRDRKFGVRSRHATQGSAISGVGVGRLLGRGQRRLWLGLGSGNFNRHNDNDFCHLARCDRSRSHFRCQSNNTATAAGTGNIDPKGWLGGIQGGYNWQSSSFVYGVEGDIQISGQRGSATICDTAGYPSRLLGNGRRESQDALVRNVARPIRFHSVAALAGLRHGRPGVGRNQGQLDGRTGRRRRRRPYGQRQHDAGRLCGRGRR